MAFYTPAGTKVLNLPEQVQKNLEDIADLKTAQTALETSKQDASTAVTKESLVTDISGKGVDLGTTSVTSLTNTGNTTNNGTLDQEGTATFGSDVEVDGNVTLNSPESILFKTGSLDFSELTSFIDDYAAEGANFLYNGAVAYSWEEGTSTLFRPFDDFPWLKAHATSLKGFFSGVTIEDKITTVRIECTGPITSANDMLSRNTRSSSADSLTYVVNVTNGITGYLTFRNISKSHSDYLSTITTENNTKLTGNLYQTFCNCASCTEIGTFDLSESTGCNGMFLNDSRLTAIHCTHFKWSFDIHHSTLFTEEALVEIIGNLDTVSTAQTLTMGSTNLAKLTEDEILVATGKGWTLA